MSGCLSLCGRVMDWRPVQGVSCPSPDDSWDRLQPPCDPTDRLSGYRKMDGWMELTRAVNISYTYNPTRQSARDEFHSKLIN